MNDESAILTKPYLNKSIEACTVQELENITSAYPYFAPAQLALLKKLKLDNLPGYEKQLQKAVLYFYDPLQFEAFIDSEKFITEFDFTAVKAPAQPETVEEENESEETIPQTEEVAERPQKLTQAEPITPGASAPSPSKINAPKPYAPALTFEPYHMVDYFASQGIKLSQEESSSDRISKQLKSFTEWLKTMKRLPAPELTQNLDPSTEHKVENLAAQSLDNTDVVTEAMAEVWLKQGNKERAIEIYNKLSLQNPSKKDYFAAKIENLKAS